MIDTRNTIETIVIIYGKDLPSSVPALSKFTLEFTMREELCGSFHLFFISETGQMQAVMSGNVYDRDGRYEFSPHRRENHDSSMFPHDQRLLRLLDIFSSEANSRRLLASLELDEALDEICPVRTWGIG